MKYLKHIPQNHSCPPKGGLVQGGDSECCWVGIPFIKNKKLKSFKVSKFVSRFRISNFLKLSKSPKFRRFEHGKFVRVFVETYLLRITGISFHVFWKRSIPYLRFVLSNFMFCWKILSPHPRFPKSH